MVGFVTRFRTSGSAPRSRLLPADPPLPQEAATCLVETNPPAGFPPAGHGDSGGTTARRPAHAGSWSRPGLAGCPAHGALVWGPGVTGSTLSSKRCTRQSAEAAPGAPGAGTGRASWPRSQNNYRRARELTPGNAFASFHGVALREPRDPNIPRGLEAALTSRPAVFPAVI